MKELDNWIQAGTIVRPHGLTGEVVVDIRKDLADLVSDASVLRATHGKGSEQLLTVKSVRGRAGRPIFRLSNRFRLNNALWPMLRTNCEPP